METYVIEIVGDMMILRADGGLNTGTASQLSEKISALVAGGVRSIIVDCSQLEVISSLGLSSLLMLHTRIKRVGGEVKLCGLKGSIVQVMHITKLDRIFEFYADIEAARLAFRPKS
ncbi:MAG: STAS domain-containing protein [Phycisphaerales bacterium]|nr:STAS domain-containing protein [Phycisphaerales bacterium]